MALSVAYGERGPAPDSVTFLSGDVHHSYVSEVRRVSVDEARALGFWHDDTPEDNPIMGPDGLIEVPDAVTLEFDILARLKK